MKTKRVSDIITTKEIKTWKGNDVITINAGTGAGKSHFIKNTLYDYVKENGYKILFLVHRSNCKNQFVNELKEKSDVFYIKTYQYIEEMYRNNIKFDFSLYNYIVCDEYQYFNNDCAFNIYTDVSFQAIMEVKNVIKIFMSATGNSMKNLMKNYYKINTIDYKIKNEYSHIKSIKYYNIDDTIEKLIKDYIEKDQKIIVFIDSAEKCYEKYLLFKDYAVFNCSKNNKKYYKYVNAEEINKILITEKLTKNILFTTCCLDSGVNINDITVKAIVLDVKDTNSLVQCVGRRRKQNDKDKFNVYVKNRNKTELANMRKSLTQRAEKGLYLLFNGQESFINKYKKNGYSNMIYDIIDENGNLQKKVNILMINNNIDNKIIVEEMQTISYAKYINHLFNKKKVEVLEEMESNSKIDKYLETLVDKKLFTEEQKELKEVFANNGLKARTLGINTLNGYLKDTKSKYCIIAKKSHGKRYWSIINDVDR